MYGSPVSWYTVKTGLRASSGIRVQLLYGFQFLQDDFEASAKHEELYAFKLVQLLYVFQCRQGRFRRQRQTYKHEAPTEYHLNPYDKHPQMFLFSITLTTKWYYNSCITVLIVFYIKLQKSISPSAKYRRNALLLDRKVGV